MITGLDLNATIDYTLKDDKENPTVWKLGIVDSSLFARIHSQKDTVDMAFKYLQVALKGWENRPTQFTKVKEKILGVELEVVPMAELNKLPLSIINELYAKAIEISNLTETERKN